jgi:succinate-semialdehyde dehydrogenase/glutarate-semialdehyde dehydrogenase
MRTEQSTTLNVHDPSSGEYVGCAALHGTDAVDDAVASARRTAPEWERLGPDGRHAIVAAAVRRAMECVGTLAELQAREIGQPVALALPLAAASIQGLTATTESALDYPFTTEFGTTKVLRRARGVAALVTPWNFPLPTALGGLGPLLAGGNTVVWKPSDLCPLSALAVADALALPPGVLSVVTGDETTGRSLATHADVALTVFTGSVPAGREVGAASGERLRPTLMELGGKDPVIVDRDVDTAHAARTVAFGAFWNTGQVCTSMERIYVHEAVANEFVDAFLAEVALLRMGSPLDSTTQLGPLAGPRQAAAVRSLLHDAVARGARVLTPESRPPEGDCWMAPTVLTDVTPGMRLSREEIFGPIAPIEIVTDVDDAILRAQQGRFGLGATILSNNPATISRAPELPAGVVWVNEWQGGSPGLTYEPVRDSGMGTVGTLDSVTRPMVVHLAAGPPTSPLLPTWYPDR